MYRRSVVPKPLSIIDMKDYGLLDGETILSKAMTLLGLVMK